MTDPDRIEHDIDETREALRRTLEALDARFSTDRIVDRAADLVEREGGRAAEAALRTARKNPVATGLVAGGLALFLTDTFRSSRPEADTSSRNVEPAGPASAAYDPRMKPTAPGLSQPEPPMAGFDERLEAAERATSDIQSKGDSDMAHTHDTAIADRVKRSARSMRKGLYDGLDRLPAEARDRVVAARLAAIDAQHAVEAQMRRTAESAQHTAREHPLLLGIAALGIGAAIGAALPRTHTENRAVGAQRDRLFDEADRVFREEVAKARDVAEAAVEEGRSAVKDTLRDGPPSGGNPAKRVSDAAESEARRQKLGRVG